MFLPLAIIISAVLCTLLQKISEVAGKNKWHYSCYIVILTVIQYFRKEVQLPTIALMLSRLMFLKKQKDTIVCTIQQLMTFRQVSLIKVFTAKKEANETKALSEINGSTFWEKNANAVRGISKTFFDRKSLRKACFKKPWKMSKFPSIFYNVTNS